MIANGLEGKSLCVNSVANCPFCSRSFTEHLGSYGLCRFCDVMVSKVAAAGYDSDYYYALRNSRSRRSYRRAMLLATLAEENLEGDKCLDFGCNDGAFVATMTGLGHRCIGVDINESSLEVARNCDDGEFRHPDEVSECFGSVTAFDVIEHFETPKAFFKCADRFVRPGGRLIITTPNKNSKWRKIYDEGWHGYGIPQYHRLILSEKFLESQFSLHGYSIERIITVPPIESPRWRLLLASGYRLRRGKIRKVLMLPFSAWKLLQGRRSDGEEDTIYAVARKVW